MIKLGKEKLANKHSPIWNPSRRNAPGLGLSSMYPFLLKTFNMMIPMIRLAKKITNMIWKRVMVSCQKTKIYNSEIMNLARLSATSFGAPIFCKVFENCFSVHFSPWSIQSATFLEFFLIQSAVFLLKGLMAWDRSQPPVRNAFLKAL